MFFFEIRLGVGLFEEFEFEGCWCGGLGGFVGYQVHGAEGATGDSFVDMVLGGEGRIGMEIRGDCCFVHQGRGKKKNK